MTNASPLQGRAQEILHAIIRTYIQTGEPVGSRTVSKIRHQDLSPASIRNVMQDLAEEGYLAQPHTSAGRVPTEKAFQDFVQSLSAGRMPALDAERVRVQLEQSDTFEDRIERSSRILTELTRNVAIAAAMPDEAQELDQIELIRLGDRRVLMIVVTRDHMVRERVLTLAEPVTPLELESVRNYVNHQFAGWRLGDARRELLRRMEEERAAYDNLMSKLNVLSRHGLLDTGDHPDVHLEGAFHLVGLDLHLTRERLRDLMRALEEKRMLVDLLDRFLERPTGEVAVKVGLADAHPAMKELSLIGVWVRMPAGGATKIAVLGPMRMNYERVMSAVAHIGRTLENI